MKIAIAQMNPVVGDIKNNAQRALAAALRAQSMCADFIIFPELFLCGYPPKDLLLRSDFISEILKNLDFLAHKLPIRALIGTPYPHEISTMPYNAACLIDKGSITVAAKKCLLPNYNVFDEKRYFSESKKGALEVLAFDNYRFLVSICEDAWNGPPFLDPKKHAFDPVSLGFSEHQDINGFINISASPYSVHKPALREELFSSIAKNHAVPVFVCGQVGGNDQLLFDGHSLVIDASGHIVMRAEFCQEDLLIYDDKAPPKKAPKPLPKTIDLMRDALIMGIKDYVEKCSGKGLLIGLSGGIDSAVCAALSVLALSPQQVRGVFLPSQFSSPSSLEDARTLAANLGIPFSTIPITDTVALLNKSLAPDFTSATPQKLDIAEQNLQARARGVLLMGISNVSDFLLLATSNKSELAVGYATLYGDMCGAFSPLADVYKTDVWLLAQAINKINPVIPESIINKAPSAELKAGQKDEDSLPPYEILDEILRRFVDEEKDAATINQETNIELALINHIITLIKTSEYKRRQAPFALMVSDKVFGDARRQPIAALFEY